jgi:hypothetical protein
MGAAGGVGGSRADQIALCVADGRDAGANAEWRAAARGPGDLRAALAAAGMPGELVGAAAHVERVFEARARPGR